MIEITKKGKKFKFTLENDTLKVEHNGEKTNVSLFKNFMNNGKTAYFGRNYIVGGLNLEKKEEKYKKLKQLKEKGKRRKLFKKLTKKENRKEIKEKAQENGGFLLIKNPIVEEGELYIYATPEGEAVKNRIRA